MKTKIITTILFFLAGCFALIALNSCVTTETTDAKGVVTKIRRMDENAVRIVAPFVAPLIMPPVHYAK